MTPIDIIIPVYDGLQEVRDCLASVLASSPVAAELVVINDASPNPEIHRYLDELADSGRITLLVNETNLGFVQTVNRGMCRHGDRDVVLLNSDTLVSGDWLERLRAAAHSEADIGTVTPFSNNAEICSFPMLCQDNTLALPVAEIDRALAQGLAGQRLPIPTAVGFCMYIRRDCLAEVGEFDAETFGRGYGEENDFCQRASAAGWRHLLAADCFVAHVGGVSFSGDKQALVAQAMDVLDRRYPRYHAQIAEFIAADPPYALRCKGMIECLRADPRPRVLAVTHHLGGGTEKHVKELSDASDARARLLVLKPFRDTVMRLSLGVDSALPGLNFDWAQAAEREALLSLLRYLGVARIHIHHLLGMDEVVETLLETLSPPFDITLHDFYMIDGNPTLTDPTGLYRPERASRGDGCNSARVLEDEEALGRWQARHQALFDRAERIFAPSRAALELYAAHYRLPGAVVTGHADFVGVASLPVEPASPAPGQPTRVLVLGALGLEKGADLLEAVAVAAAKAGAALEFVLLGYAYRPLDRAVEVLGPYADAELDTLIAGQSAQLVWFPCRWPETYSYTLSAALRAGLPLVVPNIGSFPERVAGRPCTWIVDYDASAETCLQQLLLARADLERRGSERLAWQPPRLGDFRYDSDYGGDATPVFPAAEFSLADVCRHLAGGVEHQAEGRRLRLLRLLVFLKRQPALAWLARLIPFKWQRRIKRRLSRRPLHDLVS